MTSGIKKLLSSSKGTLCLLVLSSMTTLAAFGKIDSTAYAAGCTIVSAIFCYTRAKTDMAAANFGANQ